MRPSSSSMSIAAPVDPSRPSFERFGIFLSISKASIFKYGTRPRALRGASGTRATYPRRQASAQLASRASHVTGRVQLVLPDTPGMLVLTAEVICAWESRMVDWYPRPPVLRPPERSRRPKKETLPSRVRQRLSVCPRPRLATGMVSWFLRISRSFLSLSSPSFNDSGSL